MGPRRAGSTLWLPPMAPPRVARPMARPAPKRPPSRESKWPASASEPPTSRGLGAVGRERVGRESPKGVQILGWPPAASAGSAVTCIAGGAGCPGDAGDAVGCGDASRQPGLQPRDADFGLDRSKSQGIRVLQRAHPSARAARLAYGASGPLFVCGPAAEKVALARKSAILI